MKNFEFASAVFMLLFVCVAVLLVAGLTHLAPAHAQVSKGGGDTFQRMEQRLETIESFVRYNTQVLSVLEQIQTNTAP